VKEVALQVCSGRDYCNPSEDEDDREFAKRLRSNPFSLITFTGMVRVRPEVLIVEEAMSRGSKMWNIAPVSRKQQPKNLQCGMRT